MSVKIYKPLHKLINKNGASIWLPANIIGASWAKLAIPDIHVTDSAQRYPLGTKLEFADGRVFRYCKASSSGIGYTARLVANGWRIAEDDVDGFTGYVYKAIVAGDETVEIADTVSRAENYYEGGYFGYSPAGGQYITHRICGSEAGDGTSVLLYLDDPLRSALAVSSRECKASPCMFGNCIGGLTQQQWKSFVCVNQVAVTASYYFWGQTKGPCHLVNYGDGATECGGTINYRAVYGMVTDGSICDQASTPTGYQMVGYVIPVTKSGYGDILIQLILE